MAALVNRIACATCGSETLCLIKQHTPDGQTWMCVDCLNKYDGPDDGEAWTGGFSENH